VHDRRMDERLVSRGEVTAMLLAIFDLNANVERIVWILEGGDDGTETEADA
jgi:hypothetical protein